MSAAGPTNFPVISLISRESNPVERIAPDRSRNRAAFTSPPKIRALYEATYFTGLRKAGMPEE
jgi:hypothetical protein